MTHLRGMLRLASVGQKRTSKGLGERLQQFFNAPITSMPCYSPWNDYLEPGTPQFEQAKVVVVAKLKAVTHIIDYYYKSHGLKLPELAEGTMIDSHRQPRSPREFALREMICHHFSCDGVDFCSLYDVASLLSPQIESERAYLAVVLPCATLMRMHKERFVPARMAKDGLDA